MAVLTSHEVLVPRPLILKLHRSSFLTKECKAPRGTCFCLHARAAAGDGGGWTLLPTSFQPIASKCCSAMLMFVALGAGIGAASMSLAPLRARSFDCLPSVRHEVNVFPGLAESSLSKCLISSGLDVLEGNNASSSLSKFLTPSKLDVLEGNNASSSLSKFLTPSGLDVLEGNNASCSEIRKYMQMQITDCDRPDVHDVYTDSTFKKLRHATVDKSQDALYDLCEQEVKPTFDQGFLMQNLEAATSQTYAKSNGVLKPSQEGSSMPFRLTVPLRIVSLRGSLPPVWPKNFSLSQSKRVRLSVESQNSLNDIISALRSAIEKKNVSPRSILAADLVTIGDSWLELAISGGLIEPIKSAEQQDWFKRLSVQWQNFVRKDKNGTRSSDGLIWGVPYRCGSMVIAYKKDLFLKNSIPPLEDWQDLWRPELQGQIAMVDSPREVVGAVLKSLGASYNTQDFEKGVMGGKEAVKRQFLALQKQVKVFDSVHYLKAFGSDDVWVAVGWSSDVIPVAKRMSNVRVVVPKSGVSLWADLWAIPAASSVSTEKLGSRVHGASPLIHQWFDFCLQPAQGSPFKEGVFTGASPEFFLRGDPGKQAEEQRSMSDTQEHSVGVVKKTRGPAMDTNMIDGMPPKECLEKSEVLEPLLEKAVADYRWLFSQTLEQPTVGKKLMEIFKQGSLQRLPAAAGKENES